MDQEIGARLKLIREQLELSQRQLARQSGVANATISQIEAGKLNPTVSMLKKVLDGIPVRLSEFFGDRVYRTLVPRNVRVAEAPSHGLPVLVYDPRSKGALAHVALAGEMLRRHEKRHIA